MKMISGLIIIFAIFLLVPTISSAQKVISQDKFNGWKYYSAGSEEIMFDVNIKDNHNICLDPKFSDLKTINECTYDEKTAKEVCEDIVYQIPTTIKLVNTNSIFNLPKLKGSFCYTIENPLHNLWWKFGDESIILQGDTSYASNDTNITQETGFAHLNVTDNNIILYMPFDINQTTTVYDYTNYSNDGTITGANWTTYGKYGGAFNFDGNGDYISLPLNKGFYYNETVNRDYTISMWVKPTEGSGDADYIFKAGTDSSGANNQRPAIYFDSNYAGVPKYVFSLGNGTNRNSIVVGGFINQWTHIVGVIDDFTTLRLYVNGVESNTPITIFGNIIGESFNAIGAAKTSGNFANGTIDEVMIWNRTLTASEINETYKNQSSRFKPTGQQEFQNLNFGTNNTVNITIQECQTNERTNLSAQINNGNIINFTVNSTGGCFINDYPLTGLLTNANLTIYYHSDNNSFYTPLVIGNITLDDWYLAPPFHPPFSYSIDKKNIGSNFVRINWTPFNYSTIGDSCCTGCNVSGGSGLTCESCGITSWNNGGYAFGDDNGIAGDFSTYIGDEAGGNCTENHITAIGSNAGINNQGTFSTMVGRHSGENNLGSYLSSLGYRTAEDNIGNYVSAFGSYAGNENTGSHLTAAGYRAGDDNTGNHVLAMGSGTGRANSGDDSIFIGYNVGRNNNQDDILMIDNEETNQSLIWGDFANDEVRVHGDLNVTGNATYNGFYGGMWFHNGSGVPIEWNDTYQTFAFTNATNLNGFTFEDGVLTNINGDGMYQVIWNAVGTGVNNHIYHGVIFVNEVEQENTLGHSKGLQSNEVQIGSHGFIYLKTGDNVTMRGKDVGDTTSGDAIMANLNLVRVGN